MRAAPPERLRRADLLEDVQTALSASGRGETGLRVGLEVEVIPVDADGRRLPLAPTAPGSRGGSSLSLVEGAARREGWRREGDGRSPVFVLPGGSVAFEPGGQIEVRTNPSPAVCEVVRAGRDALKGLWRAADGLGVSLVTRGMDPGNDPDDVSLQLDSPRYRRQLAHYTEIGPWGRRMMLMSAALHLNVDLGGRAVRRWAVANRMAPYLTALFANSPRWMGEGTGVRSWRAEQWRRLDPSRTGLFCDEEDPAREYLDFALGARHFLARLEGRAAEPFRRSWEAGAGRESWRSHLTTLFPEVRPRRYLEIRSVDALRPAWLPVPALVVSGVLYDPEALMEAHALLPPASAERLVRAGQAGLSDPKLAATALQLFDLGVEGARRRARERDGLGLEVAEAFRARFTAQGLDPGHEGEVADPFAV